MLKGFALIALILFGGGDIGARAGETVEMK